MKIWVHIHTRTTYGGHASFSLVGRYFESGCPDFGSAIREIDADPYFVTPGETVGSAESTTDLYGRFIAGLPTCRLSRKKAKLGLNYLSRLGDSRLVEGYGPPKLDLFAAAAKELADHLSLISQTLKRSDDFDVSAFSAWVCSRLEALPRTPEELVVLKAQLDAEEKAAYAAMDEWEKLGVDWEDFHPHARQILDRPFYWECANDFAPHGNDTGADVLSLYAEWRNETRHAPALDFLKRLMCDWGMSAPYPSEDDAMNLLWEEAKIGLAFAQLKVDGRCDEPVRTGALEAIVGYRTRVAEQHPDWDLLPERLHTLELMETKLKSA